MNFSLVVYTHSEYKDVFHIFYESFKKYFQSPIKKYIFSNKKLCFEDYQDIIYDDNQIYTNRVLSSLNEIDDEIILFSHEDMILYDHVNLLELETASKKIKEKNIDYIKLIKTGNDTFTQFDENLYYFPQNSNTFFAVQPTLWNKKSFIRFLKLCGEKNIWDLEKYCQEICRDNFNGLYWFDLKSRKRGEAHWDSSIYPYIATAIVKGKWNFKEYELELLKITKNIDLNFDIRGRFL